MSTMETRNSAQVALIEESDDNKFWIRGLRRNRLKWLFSWLLIICSFGFVRLLFYWKPNWHARMMTDQCPLGEAQMILITDQHHACVLRTVKEAKSTVPEEEVVIPCPGGKFITAASYNFFSYRKLRYIYHPELQKFARIFSLDEQVSCHDYHEWAGEGLSIAEVARRLLVYGKNEITVKLKPILVLLFLEVISPFYVFQVFSVIVWYNDEYYYYASVIVLMSVVSIAADVYQTRKQEKSLRDMVYSVDMVQVIRDGQMSSMFSTALVPGDLIVIPKHGSMMQCDAVLLSGTCIVNESMLTGESVPITKTPVPEAEKDEHASTLESPLKHAKGPIYTDKEHAKHTLFCGTRVLQTRFYSGQHVKALVIRTGYSTMKGQLVRSIMYPKPVDFQFTKDLMKFVGCLACIASIGFVYTIVLMAEADRGIKKIILRSLDIITIVVPPALPAAMTIGILAAQMRLKRKKIFCISPSTINTCGAINVVCFDKTGTLTEDGLDFYCAVPTEPSAISGNGTEKKFVDEPNRTLTEIKLESALLRAVACCHSLTRIEGDICGDPLDMILFTETGWSLEEPEVVEETGRFDMLAPTVVRSPKGSNVEIGILRQFTFSSHLQRMSVIVRALGDQDLMLFCKGAPEKVASLCLPETVPQCFSVILQGYARHGYRILGLAQKRLTSLSFVKAQRVKREQVEVDMEFLGLVVMENRLKPETTPVISQLRMANIRTVMVTGDNLLTAMSVARECGILDSQKELYILDTCDPEFPGAETFLQLRSADSVLGRSSDVFPTETNGELAGSLDPSMLSLDLERAEKKMTPKYEIAMTGATFAVLIQEYPEWVQRLMCVCNIFARMSPEQKGQLVDKLQSVDYVVAMCGDGANDCGALKAAHAGISLSEAEASIASPFTSQTPDIRCVPTVIKEGRAALVTSFGVFKYMAAYSMTQFISVSLLYWIGTNLADFQFLYIDLFLITVFAVCFGYQDAAEVLVRKPPPARILSVPSICSVICNLAIVASFQIFIFLFVEIQPWYIPYTDPGEEDNYYSFKGTCIFWVSVYQYITLAVVYSKGFPYRKSLFNNKLLSGALLVCTALSLWFTIYPPSAMSDFLNLMMPPMLEFRLFIVLLGLFCFILCYLCEKWLIDYVLLELRDRKKFCCKRPDPEKYLEIMEDIGQSPAWITQGLERKKRQSAGDATTPGGVWTNYGATSLSSSSADEDSALLSARKEKRLGQTVL